MIHSCATTQIASAADVPPCVLSSIGYFRMYLPNLKYRTQSEGRRILQFTQVVHT
jgi:hypothetical protein